MKKYLSIKVFLIAVIVILLIYIVFDSSQNTPVNLSGNLTEGELLEFFQSNTIENNYAAAIMLDFTVPQSGTAYLGTIHGYPNNLQVCEELIEPYNIDPSMTTVPGSTYYCEELR